MTSLELTNTRSSRWLVKVLSNRRAAKFFFDCIQCRGGSVVVRRRCWECLHHHSGKRFEVVDVVDIRNTWTEPSIERDQCGNQRKFVKALLEGHRKLFRRWDDPAPCTPAIVLRSPRIEWLSQNRQFLIKAERDLPEANSIGQKLLRKSLAALRPRRRGDAAPRLHSHETPFLCDSKRGEPS